MQELRNAIAIVGLAGRFPGAPDVAAFWRNLRSGIDSLTRFGDPELTAAGVRPEWLRAPGYVKAGQILPDVEHFDAEFFGLTSREADLMDPQQRLLLECAWEALETAGYPPERAPGPVGVYVGGRISEYLLFNQQPPDLAGLGDESPLVGFQRLLANDKDYLATRISHRLDLRGPSLSVQTACSTSLVAVHLAAQALLSGECDLALAGGASVRVPQRAGYLAAEGMIFSPDGHTRPFDAAAAGTVFGSGVGLVALRRFDDAVAAGDTIHAVIRGSALNNDGSLGKAAFTAPSLRAQADVVAEALEIAGVAPRGIGYVEAHGTATALGDVVEVAALSEAFGLPDRDHCALGSVKSNVGHLVQAAGVASLIKATLMLRHRRLVPSVHFREPNPRIDFASTPFFVCTRDTDWASAGGARRCGVSSFGVGGTNAHVVLEEAPAVEVAAASRPRLFVLSARTAPALETLAASNAAALANDRPSLEAAAFTSLAGRRHFGERLAAVADSIGELEERLRSAKPGGRDLVRGSAPRDEGRPRVALLFAGQGGRLHGCARGLGDHPALGPAFERADALLRAEGAPDVVDRLLGRGDAGAAETTDFVQPGLFALQMALFEALRELGVGAHLLLGHSVGELAAACAAGCVGFEAGLRLALQRGRLMQEAPPGSMAAVLGDAEQVREVVGRHPDSLAVSATNGPGHSVISGSPEAVEAALAELTAAGASTRRLEVDRAFHSPSMDGVLKRLREACDGVDWREPDTELVSALTGEPLREAPGPDYWVRHAREPVRFDAAARALAHRDVDVVVELGPASTLVSLARRIAPRSGRAFVAMLAPDPSAERSLLAAAATLYASGIDLRPDGLHPGAAQRVPLPTYPFERRRHWIERTEPGSARAAVPGTALRRVDSPLADATFEWELHAQDILVSDHRVAGRPTLPATASVECLLQAGRAALGTESGIADLVLLRPVSLSDGERVRLQIVVDRDAGTHRARVFCRDPGGADAAWTLVATARLEPVAGGLPQVALDEVRARCGQAVDVAALYAGKRARGFGHGPAFQALAAVFVGQAEALARVVLPEPARGVADLPVMLDAALQAVEAAEPRLARALHLPAAFDRVRLVSPVPAELFAHVRARDAGPGLVVADVDLVTEAGAVVVEVRGLHLRRLAALRVPEDGWVYAVDWERVAPAPGPAARTRWLIAGDGGDDLAAALDARGCHAVRLAPDARAEGRWDGLVFVATRASDGDPARAAAATLHPLFVAAQDVAAGRCATASFVVVTRGAQSVAGGDADPVQAPLLGLCRVLRREHRELDVRMVDLEAGGSLDLRALVSELGDDVEDEVAWRAGERWAVRLVGASDRLAPDPGSTPGGPVRLARPRTGVLDELALEPMARQRPGRGEVEIRVEAAALNFRDVLNALGRFEDSLGFECAGQVSVVGPGVARLAVGDRVVALGRRSLASYVTLPAHQVQPMPPDLDAQRAAGVSLVFVTAVHALERLARLRRGERLLIHAAAGGVGLAALQVARGLGAEVFATASRGKWDYLRSLGVEHVMDSRRPGFAQRTLELTGGRGVDVVLNSLSGELLDESLACLSREGRFVELGVSDPSFARKWASRRPSARFDHFRMMELARDEPQDFQGLYADVVQRLAEGRLSALPTRSFEAAEAAAAFRHMAEARHVGKVVLDGWPHAGEAESPRRVPVRAAATYLITGANGGLARHVLRWLAERGARHLVLASRSEPDEESLRLHRELSFERAVHVKATRLDVADAAAVDRLVAEIRGSGRPLAGVFHLAGVLDDAALAALDWARVERVLAPKLAGSWNLHAATRDDDLDVFVLFSSISGVWGTPGQSAYAAANAFLDALAHRRRAHGLPCLSVSWGAWAGAGMADALEEGPRRGRERIGLADLEPEQALDLLDRALSGSEPHVAVVSVDEARFAAQFAGHRAPSLVRHWVARSPTAPTDAPADAASAPSPLPVRVRAEVAATLGIEPGELPGDRSLMALGLDSLQAIELRNRLRSKLGADVPLAELLANPTLDGLLSHLGAAPEPHTPTATQPRAVPVPSPGDGSAELEHDAAHRWDPFPLTDVQEAYWVGRRDELSLGHVGCHSYLEHAIDALDVDRLSAAWLQVVERHDMLRMVVDDDGRQRVLESVPRRPIPVLDLSGATEDEARRRLEAIRAELSHQVLPSDRWPLFDVRVTRLPRGRLRLHLSLDALIVDAWSLYLLYREWGRLYEHPDAPESATAITFRDYVLAERRARQTSDYERSHRYWWHRIDTLPPGPELPLARGWEQLRRPLSRRLVSDLPSDEWGRLRRHAEDAGLTPSGLLVAALGEVLRAWSAQPAFTLNVTTFRREPWHPDVGRLLGDFTSLTLLEVADAPDQTFLERARLLQARLWSDLEHARVGGVAVLREWTRRRRHGPRVSMPVVFTSHLGVDPDAERGGSFAWLGEPVESVGQTPQVWLDVGAAERAGRLHLRWNFVEGLFPDGLMEDVFGAWRRLLSDLSFRPGAWQEQARATASRLVPEPQLAARRRINGVPGPAAGHRLHELFECQAARTPDAPAVVSAQGGVGYAELAVRAAAVAAALRAAGATRGDRVGILLPRGPGQIAAALGVLRAGAAYVPLDVSLPEARVHELLADAGVERVVTDAAHVARLSWPAGVSPLALEGIRDAPAAEDSARHPDDLAYVIYTSGSTGRPKGVAMTHRAAVHTILEINRRFRVGPADRVLGLSSLAFDLSVYDVFGLLAAGGAVVVPGDERSPQDWAHWLDVAGVTIWNSVPILNRLLVEHLESIRRPLAASMRLVLLSGDWIPVGLPDRLRRLGDGLEVVSLGGATETGIWSVVRPIGAVDPAWDSIPYGQPLAGQTAEVLDASLAPRPCWAVGDLYIGGASLAREYWGDPEKTEASFVRHPEDGRRLYRTGDLARHLPDGDLEFLGRLDTQVKVAGNRVELAEVEACLARHPGVHGVAVKAWGPPRGDRRLAAYFVASDGVSAADLRGFVEDRLPHAMVPQAFVELPVLPVTPNGKLDRSALPEPPGWLAAEPGEPARDATLAGRIAALAADILHVDVGPDDDLLELGASSVDLIRLANRLQSELAWRPRLEPMYRDPTPSALAKACAASRKPPGG